MRNCEYHNSLLLFCTLQVSSVNNFNLQICVVVLGFFLFSFLSVCLLSRSTKINLGRILALGGTPEQILCHPNFQIRDLNVCAEGLGPS